MDLFALESFLEVVQKGNFSRAAESLSLTQPALSQRIKQLEAELEYPLLIRKKGSQVIELTCQGKSFVEIAKQMLELWGSAKKLTETEEVRQQLNVSIIDSVMTCTIPAVIHNFVQDHPEINVSLNNYHSLESYSYIENNEIDIAIVGKLSRARGAISYPIYSDPWVFICGKDAHYPDVVHPSELDITLQLLLCNKDVDDWQEYWFSGIDNSKPGTNKISYFNKYLFEGENWAVLPLSIARFFEQSANGVIHKIIDGPAPRIVYMVQSNKADPDAVRKFKTCVHKELTKVSGITLLFQPEGHENLIE